MDAGSLISTFSKLATYSYTVDGLSFSVDATANSLTAGTLYRFQFRAKNAMGYSDFSDSVRFGLGPLPDTPNAPTRYTSGNSDTSIGVTWTELTA